MSATTTGFGMHFHGHNMVGRPQNLNHWDEPSTTTITIEERREKERERATASKYIDIHAASPLPPSIDCDGGPEPYDGPALIVLKDERLLSLVSFLSE